MAQLADGGGFAGAIDPDHQNDGGRGRQIQCHILSHHFGNDLLDQLHDLSRIRHAPLLDPLAQLFTNLHRGFHPHVAHDHGFLQLFKQILIDLGKGIDHPLHTADHGFLGFPQSLFDFTE